MSTPPAIAPSALAPLAAALGVDPGSVIKIDVSVPSCGCITATISVLVSGEKDAAVRKVLTGLCYLDRKP